MLTLFLWWVAIVLVIVMFLTGCSYSRNRKGTCWYDEELDPNKNK